MKAFRHGDLALIQIENMPQDLKQSKTDIIMKGSHGHNHKFQNGKFYPLRQDNFVIGYFEALDNCILTHPEHGKVKGNQRVASIPKGFYELRKQNEFVNDELKPVVD